MSRSTLPEIAPPTDERLSELRRVMDPETWDVLYPYMPLEFIRAYDQAVETLYGSGQGRCEASGYRTTYEAQAIPKPGFINGGWLFRDERALPIKKMADAKARRIAKRIQTDPRYSKPKRISRDLSIIAERINWMLIESGIAPLVRGPLREPSPRKD